VEGLTVVILSHQYRFIYIRCRKTASTSIELALSRICGPDDILSSMLRRSHEDLRRQLGSRGPQHDRNPDGTARFYSHMSAAEVRVLVGERVWNSYYKWCVERNPWDKVVSHYYSRHRNPATRPPLVTFLESGSAHRAVNFRLYTIGAEVTVDHIARYEELPAELDRIAALLNLPAGAMELPRANGGFRPERQHYSQLYTPEERDFVAELFADEIALHGYRYDEREDGSNSTIGYISLK
jgi:Sulfotransferase family